MNKTIKVVMLGCGGVGKTAISTRKISGLFVGIYDPTIEDSYRTSINVDRVNFILDIFDTGGSEDYSPLTDAYTRHCDGFVVVYSITSQTSLLEAEGKIYRIYQTLEKEYSEHIPIILVGNKCDLEEERVVRREEGQKIATEWGIPFLECSAKNDINISQLYLIVTRDFIFAFKEQPPQELIINQKKRRGCILC